LPKVQFKTALASPGASSGRRAPDKSKPILARERLRLMILKAGLALLFQAIIAKKSRFPELFAKENPPTGGGSTAPRG
jgi:hypothetical protein